MFPMIFNKEIRKPIMKLLVVGAGSIGRRHIKNLLRLAENRDMGLSVVEPDDVIRKRVCGERGLAGYEDMSAAFGGDAFDAAFICTPNHLHVPQAKEAVKHGCHVFVEKPLALDWRQAETLAPLLRERNRFLMGGCNLWFHPGVRTLANALAERLIGLPLYCRARFAHYLPNWRPGWDYRRSYSAQKSQGGGILLDAVHEPDYLCRLFGGVSKVWGSLCRIGDLEIDVEDTANYVLWHGGAFFSEVHVDFLRRDKARGCEVVGTHGTLVWQSEGKNPERVSVRRFDARSGEWTVLHQDEAYDLNAQYVDEMDYFLRCVEDGAEPMNGLEETLHVLKVLDGVRASSDCGRIQTIHKGGKDDLKNGTG